MRTFTIGDIQLDKQDRHFLREYTIFIVLKGGYYPVAVAYKNKKRHYLHQLIMNSRELVDHADRNPLNNKRSNLRFATKSTNAMNSKLRTDNATGVKGVYYDKKRKQFEVYITVNKKRTHLGRYKTLKEAALIRAKAERVHFKDFANQDLLNEIKLTYGT